MVKRVLREGFPPSTGSPEGSLVVRQRGQGPAVRWFSSGHRKGRQSVGSAARSWGGSPLGGFADSKELPWFPPFTTAVHASPTVRNCRGFHATCDPWPDPKTAVADHSRLPCMLRRQ
ncbi:MAG: hypothetical protein ACHBN1_33160 [Heteroscytonema crispum UTEX LB 1556]